LDWAKIRWPDDPPTNLAELSRLTGGRLAAAVEALNRAIYGAGEKNWQGESIWKAFAAMEGSDDARKDVPQAGLEPLYKL
jgi:hypothetical protein